MDLSRQEGGAVLTDAAPTHRRWLLVRSQRSEKASHAILDALERRVRREGIELVEVLLGEASLEVEDPIDGSSPPRPCWLLEEDARGRGVHPDPGRAPRVVTKEELALALMSSERVVTLP